MSQPIVGTREHARPVTGWLGANWPRLAAALTVAVVAAVAGTVSYGHIAWLTTRLGGSPLVAHLMPLAVDGQIITGSIVLLTAKGRTARWGWLGIGPGLAESLAANYMAGAPHGLLAAGWYMVAAQSFAVASFLLERLLKSLVSQDGQTGQGGRAEQAGEPETAPEPVIEYVTVEVPVEVPVSCGHEFPADADQAVISAWLHSRECEGEELSQRQLADRFGRTRHQVAALVRDYLHGAEREARDVAAGGGDPAAREPEAASA